MPGKAIVIGAGISGLSAAQLLAESGVDVIVLEARDRVGGRTYTYRDPGSYQYTDVGGSYVGPTQRRVARKALQFGLEFYKVNEIQQTVLDIEGIWMKFFGTLPEFTDASKGLDFQNLVQLIDSMSKEVPIEAPWKAPRAEEWDQMNMKDFIDRYCWSDFGKQTARLMTSVFFAVEPHELSLLYFLWYMASGQGIQRLTSVTNGAQERKIIGGSQQLSERMALKLGGPQRVFLRKPVVRVDQCDSGVKVTTADGSTYEADYVISAMPAALLNKVAFSPPLPARRNQLIQRIPMGCVIKTMMFYEKSFWREKGYCGQLISNLSPIMYALEDTKPDGTAPCICGFIVADHARDLMDLTPEERKQKICERYAEAFKCEEFLHPINYIEYNWAAEEYSGGCYVSTMPPGILTKYGPVLREPVGRIFWAGTETALLWSGYMDGAIDAGERAAREVMHALGMIRKEEIFQEEPEHPNLPEAPFEPRVKSNL